jgi:hypothetical protein
MVIMPLSELVTRWRRERSAVRSLPASRTSGRSPAQVPTMSDRLMSPPVEKLMARRS